MQGVAKKLSQAGRQTATLLVAGALLACAPAVGRADAYLAVIGPSPLRFAAARPAASTPTCQLPPGNPQGSRGGQRLSQTAEPDTSTGALESQSGPAITPESAFFSVPAPDALNPFDPAATAAGIPTDASPQEATRPDSQPTAPPVTPQVLVEYFSSDPTQTNRQALVVVSVPEVKFTPPVPQALPASRAVYKSE